MREDWKEVVVSLSGIYKEADPGEGAGRILVDLTELPGTTFFCEDPAAKQIREALARLPLPGLHWIDSGDYHYVSLFWLEQIRTPFVLLMLDHHSDLQESAFGAGLLSCGNWLLQSLRSLPLLKKVILIGPEDGEVCSLDPALAQKVMWVREEELKDAWEEIRRTLAGSEVYLSIDKDVLAEKYCVSGWSQGALSPERILALIAMAFAGAKVLGMDICGEAPPERARFDAAAVRINRETNRQLREGIARLQRSGGPAFVSQADTVR